MTVYLVRHGSAGDRDGWNGPDPLRPLDDVGRKQASELADLFAEVDAEGEAGRGVDRVVSSPYLRCVQTVQPLAERLGCSVEREPALAEGADTEATVALVRSLAPAAAVLCTHGDIVSNLLERLSEVDGLALPGDYPYDKGSTWVLTADGAGRFVRAAHLPPLA